MSEGLSAHEHGVNDVARPQYPQRQAGGFAMNCLDLSMEGWAQFDGSFARGYAHLGDRFLPPKALAATLDACRTDADWLATIGRLNGCFAVASMCGGRLLAAVDRIRSIPLFYAIEGNCIRLSDSAYRVAPRQCGGTIDDIVRTEFCLTGYVTGMQTLHPSVLQIEAGQALVCDESRAGPPDRKSVV